VESKSVFVPEPKPLPTQKLGPEPLEKVLETVTGNMSWQSKDGSKGEATLPLVDEQLVRLEPVKVLVPVDTPTLDDKELEAEVATLDSALLLKIADNPEIADALAKEGLVIDQSEVKRAVEENVRRAALETVLSPDASVADLAKAFHEELQEAADLESPTAESFRDFKIGINSYFE
jgi:hypothetical protein